MRGPDRPRAQQPGQGPQSQAAATSLPKRKTNFTQGLHVIHAMGSTISARGQTVVPAPIRAFRGCGAGGSTARLRAERRINRQQEGG